MNSVDIALKKKGFGSLAALARVLAKEPAFSGLPERTLSNYLGNLRKGDARWWHNRPECAEALAALTDLTARDLGLVEEASDRLVPFPGFPELRPLDLASELPAPITEDISSGDHRKFQPNFWLEPASWRAMATPAAGIYWLEVPHGVGLDIFWARAEAQGQLPCLSLSRLGTNLPEIAQRGPAILRVAEPTDQEGLRSLCSAGIRAPVLVLSRHPPPESLPNGRGAPLKSVMGSIFRDDLPQVAGAMRRTLRPEWREVFVGWILRRLSSSESVDTLLSLEEVERWIRGLSPWRNPVGTPRELVSLCGLLHELPYTHSKSYLAPDGGTKLIEECIAQGLDAQHFRLILRRRYLEGRERWLAPLHAREWIEFFDIPHKVSKRLGPVIKDIVYGSSTQEREAAGEVLREELGRNSLPDLSGHGALTETVDSRLGIDFPIAAELLAAEAALEHIRNADIATWARLYLDPSRRFAIEIALGWRSMSELIEDARRVLSHRGKAAERVGAEEALFWAIGMRLAVTPSSSREELPTLHALALRVLQRLPANDMRPWTRDLSEPGEDLAWLTVCWAWSLEVERPLECSTLLEQAAGLLPGWAAPEHLESLDGFTTSVESALLHLPTSAEGAPNAWPTWWSVANRVAGLFEVAPKEPPQALKPHLLMRGLDQGWKIPPDWILVTGSSKFAGSKLRKPFERLAEEQRTQLLEAVFKLWEAAGTTAGEGRNKSLRRYEDLRLASTWIPETLVSSLGVEKSVRIAGANRLWILFHLTADATAHAEDFAHAVPCEERWSDQFAWLLPRLPASAWKTVEPWLSTTVGVHAGNWLWHFAPEQALRLIEDPKGLTTWALDNLTANVPASLVPRVATTLVEIHSDTIDRVGARRLLEWLPAHALELDEIFEFLEAQA